MPIEDWPCSVPRRTEASKEAERAVEARVEIGRQAHLKALWGVALAPISDLWALVFGRGGGMNGKPNQLFFTAGPNGYANGLFGVINFK